MENDYELYDCLGCATFRGASARVSEQTFEFNFSQSKSDNTTFNNKPNNNKSINKQIMKTKFKFLKWLMVLLFTMSAIGTWAQTSQTATQTLCPGTEPYYVTPGNAANTFLWSISTGTSGVDWTITSANTVATNVIWANPLVPTTYHLSLKETNGDGCQTIVSVDVTVNPRPAAPITSLTQPICAVATGTINVTTPAPAAGITYTITGTTPVVASVTNSTGIFAGLAPGIYDVTTTNGVGCTSLATSITINAQPVTPAIPIAALTQPTCFVSTGTVNVTSPAPATGTTYTITGTTPVVAAITNSTGIFAGLAPGVYDVTTTNADGCTSLALSITINPSLSTPVAPTASITQPSCAVATGIVNVTTPLPGAGITYTITGTTPVVAAVSNSTGVFSSLTTGTYDLTTTNATGCVSAATIITINVQPLTPNTSAIWHN